MTRQTVRRLCVPAAISAALAYAAGETGSEPINIAVEGGAATFLVNTNVSAISVKGKSSALNARVLAHRAPDGLLLDKIEASIPVKSLVTGMSVRDEHMRKYIFTTPDGKTPDITFQAEGIACKGGREATCQVSGNLAIRGVAKPFTAPLKVRDDGQVLRASGESKVKLSDYGIPQPSQFGVKTEDEVRLHFEFAAKPGGPK